MKIYFTAKKALYITCLVVALSAVVLAYFGKDKTITKTVTVYLKSYPPCKDRLYVIGNGGNLYVECGSNQNAMMQESSPMSVLCKCK